VLARSLHIARNTVLGTYERLLSEGYLRTRHGAGTYVAEIPPPPAPRHRASILSKSDERLRPFWNAPPLPANIVAPERLAFDFAVGAPDARDFPFAIWCRLMSRSIRAMAKHPPPHADPRGSEALRIAIAQHVSLARAVSCRGDDIVVTTGAQQAFNLLARILVIPGKTVVAVEDPGYRMMRAAFLDSGAKVVPVPVDEEGLVVERLPRNARVICVTPSHQFPLGVPMSLGRRAALLQFARTHNAVIIEDDYDSEYRFGGRPLDALQTMDRSHSVLYIGTFSKILMPRLRIGFVVAPPWAQAALAAAKRCADLHFDIALQDTVTAFIAEGHLARHLRRMRQIYGGRRQTLLETLEREFGRWLTPIPSVAGLHLTALAPSIDVPAVTGRAREVQVAVGSLRNYYAGRQHRDGLVFGYGTIEQHAIVEGLARLHRVMNTVSRQSSRPGARR
jgi:GntR family transcriptional regulator/MocR family aminotransferase